ncbi:MAG: transposase domain-containing protein, partial [Puniceicoccales bacterium]|nr:transposase domain-containing protein [Puniceicoccales bacterium]
RKNYLFIGAPEAGQRAAILYTLIASARRRGHNPQEYLKDILRQLEQNQEAARAITNKNYQDNPLRQLAETLTPENWTQPK